MRPLNLIRLAMAIVALCAGAWPALGQTALGNGRGLERDLRVGGTGLTPREDFGAIVRYRNAIVTGQAPGGVSLRINPGYSDASDFTARLGSDDLYRFRRDSLYSGLGGMGFRGTESLQYQFSFATGNTRRTQDPYVLNRVGGAAPVSGSDRPAAASFSAYQLAEGSRAGSLRSTSSYAANQGLKPVIIGYRTVGGRDEPVAASTLLGVKGFAPRAYDAPKEDKTAGGEKPDQVRPEASPASAAPEPAFTAHDELRERLNSLAPQMFKSGPQPTRPDEGAAPTREKPEPPTTKPTILPESTASDTSPTEWQRRLAQLRRAMRPESSPAATTKTDDKGATGTSDKPKDPDRFDPFTQRLDKDTLALIRRAGQEQTKSYIAEAQLGAAAQRDVYATAMRAGQNFMKIERYFDAEERFSFALSMKSGDPTAQAGRVHAQLGSGLHASAATNLRELIEQYPDTAGMRYSLDLLPALVRQRQLLAQLRKNIAGTEPDARRIPRESALLLAYLGYQRGDADAIREGLSALKQDAPSSDAAFLAFIEGVWAPEQKPESK